MSYNTQPRNRIDSHQPSGYFDAHVHNIQRDHDRDIWVTIHGLRQRQWYLLDQLSRTVTTLNALRDAQTRNERVLSTNPRPRSKKKKTLQMRWRTDKTIKTRENEERVILDCLQVCDNNIQALLSMLQPIDTMSTTTTAYTPSGSYLEMDTPGTEIDWNGWVNGETSPFQQGCRNTLSTDEIPPDRCAQDARIPKLQSPSRKPSHLSVQCKIEPPSQQYFPLAPPNTAYTPFCHSTLSPVAANFEPRVVHEPPNLREASVTPPQLDKLSISGFLGSKSVQKMRRRRFSDAAIGHLFDSLLHDVRPRSVGDRHHSWCPGSEAEQNNDDEGGPKDDTLERARTV